MNPSTKSDLQISRLDVRAYEIPTDGPDGKESDGTFEWGSTTLIVVEVHAGNLHGLGYTYCDAAAAKLIDGKLRPHVLAGDPAQLGALWRRQNQVLRNLGRSGLGAMALSAVDIALWDLKAKWLGLPLFKALCPFHASVPVYASGGFCNYPLDRLVSQVAGWAQQGIPRIKIKTSRRPDQDPERLSACRAEIGDEPVLMTDANGALTRKEALYWARRFREQWDVTWLEEPVSS
jgi:L-alanine-DL-glutamate epimerase-like enolase superfamily enzyme